MVSTTIVRHVTPTTPLFGGLRADGTSFSYHRTLKCYTIHCDITEEGYSDEEKRREERREERGVEQNEEWSDINILLPTELFRLVQPSPAHQYTHLNSIGGEIFWGHQVTFNF